jgi:hypothetical protein
MCFAVCSNSGAAKCFTKGPSSGVASCFGTRGK